MFKSLSLSLLLCCLASAALADPVTVGLKAGSSIPNLRDNGGNDFSSGWSTRVGLFFGASLDVPVTPALSITGELNYSQQGAKKNGLQAASLPGSPQTFFADFKNTAKLDYLEIPVLARLHVGPLRRFSIALGPYVGFLLSAKNVTSGTSEVFLDKNGTPIPPEMGGPIVANLGGTTDNKSALHTFNWGMQGGVGAEYPLGRGSLALEVRGELGLMNIQKNPAVDGKNSTGALVIALGYAMPLGAVGH